MVMRSKFSIRLFGFFRLPTCAKVHSKLRGSKSNVVSVGHRKRRHQFCIGSRSLIVANTEKKYLVGSDKYKGKVQRTSRAEQSNHFRHEKHGQNEFSTYKTDCA
jgi:hypothetical protein